MRTVETFLEACLNKDESLVTEHLADPAVKFSEENMRTALRKVGTTAILAEKLLNYIHEQREQFPRLDKETLIWASAFGLTKMVESYFPDVSEEMLFLRNVHSSSDQMYILIAALDKPETLAFLLSQDKINPNILSTWAEGKASALHVACDRNNLQAVELLLKHPKIIIGESEYKALVRSDDCLPLFFENRSNPDSNQTLLKYAIEENSQYCIERILEHPKTIVQQNHILMLMTRERPHYDLIEALFKKINEKLKWPFKKWDKEYFFTGWGEFSTSLKEYLNFLTLENGEALFIKNQEQIFTQYIKSKRTDVAHKIYEVVKIDINNTSALDEAIIIKDWHYLEKLMSLPEIDLNKITEKSRLLRYIVTNKESDVAKHFLTQKMDFFSHADFQSAFDYAIVTHNFSLATALREQDKLIVYRAQAIIEANERPLYISERGDFIEFLNNAIKELPEYPFFEAIYNGDVEKVQEFLRNGTSPNTQLSRINTALLNVIDIINTNQIAMNAPWIIQGIFQPSFTSKRREHLEIRNILLNHPKVNVNAIADSDYPIPVLHKGIYYNDEETFDLVLKKEEVNVNSLNAAKETPLHMACYLGHISLIKKLLEHPDVNLTIQQTDGKTALEYIGLKNKNKDLIKILSLFLSAAKVKESHDLYPEIIKKLEENFILACERGWTSAVEDFFNIDDEMVKSDKLKLAGLIAVVKSHTLSSEIKNSIIRRVVKTISDVNKIPGNDIFFRELIFKDPRCFSDEVKAIIQDYKIAQLFDACKKGDSQKFTRFFEESIDLNQEHEGKTLIQIAWNQGHEKVLNKLLETNRVDITVLFKPDANQFFKQKREFTSLDTLFTFYRMLNAILKYQEYVPISKTEFINYDDDRLNKEEMNRHFNQTEIRDDLKKVLQYFEGKFKIVADLKSSNNREWKVELSHLERNWKNFIPFLKLNQKGDKLEPIDEEIIQRTDWRSTEYKQKIRMLSGRSDDYNRCSLKAVAPLIIQKKALEDKFNAWKQECEIQSQEGSNLVVWLFDKVRQPVTRPEFLNSRISEKEKHEESGDYELKSLRQGIGGVNN